jgi:hypothetical protein
MAIVTIEETVKENPYTGAIAELVEAQEAENTAAAKEKREAKALGYQLVLYPRIGSTGKTIGVTGQTALFQEAARNAGYTARAVVAGGVAGEEPDGTKTQTFVFKLGAKHASGPRKPRAAK